DTRYGLRSRPRCYPRPPRPFPNKTRNRPPVRRLHPFEPGPLSGGRMAGFLPVLTTPELGPGEMREVHAHGRDLLLVNVGQTYYALDARCPDDGTKLAREVRLKGTALLWSRDAAAFDVRAGGRLEREVGSRLGRYASRVEDNTIKVGRRVKCPGSRAAAPACARPCSQSPGGGSSSGSVVRGPETSRARG